LQVAEYPTAIVLPGLGDDELDAVITEGLWRQLAAGVTTVRDLGDLRYAVVNRRDVQRAGRTREPEPTIVASGPPLARVGGHCHFLGGEIANRDQISAAMRQRVQRGVDVVKVMASGA
jgi:imidazolonepropionase-like amidohydrolase